MLNTRIVIVFAIAYGVFFVLSLLTMALGMAGGDLAGIVCIHLLIAGISSVLWVSLFSRRVPPQLYGIAHIPLLGGLGALFGSVSRGEEIQAAGAGVVVGIGTALFIQLSKLPTTKRLRPRVFLSYRRSDTPYITGRIYERLANRLGAANLFMDVDHILAGENFQDAIMRTLGECDVVLAVIGGQWTTAVDDSGARRLDNPGDYVRQELEFAMKNSVHVIPVLVMDARMPRADELPPSLAGLCMCNAVRVRPDPDFSADADVLIQKIRTALGSVSVRGEGRQKAAAAS